ncbi:TMEM175 family protein [Lentzea sp. HUAS12]|uniref:TMEM175 family protein n=1 Tax=Lentzea sp. HUAS12 TaxID=2951806 RepID=UPI00209E7415|nr:TMEM175 family protein [Lentzea sp. HUAS12]USX52750.1 TMEM175 family protein [Lentzea sp. HUAS12]
MSVTREPDRLVLFTDAVVAIAITLLVLPLVEITSEPGEGPPAELVSHHWPQIFSFLLSFAVIAHLWFTHHRLFEDVRRYTTPLMVLNMAWLLTIVVLPFPTELLGTYSGDTFVRLFYVGTISSLLLTAITLLVHANPEIGREAGGLSRPVVLRAAVPPALLLLAFVLVPLIGYYGLLLMLLSPLAQRIR